jgi:hypothetical protein
MNAAVTRDGLAVWLAAVHADPELTARDFKIAFALSQACDAKGFIRSGAAPNLGRADEAVDAEPIAHVLGRLAARGHLEACGNQRKVEGFRIIIKAAKEPVARRAKVARVVPFPAARRHAFIHKQAGRMAALSRTRADAYLRQQLRIQADTMRRRGVAEETIGREVKSIESAIRAEMWKCVLTPERPA